MDPDCSAIDYSMEEECSKEQDYTPILSDDALLLILSELSWKDILNVKLLSRRFYGVIHRNNHRLERRGVVDLSIKYNGNCGEYPFFIKMGDTTVRNESSDVIQHDSYSKINRFKSCEELSSFLKMVDLRNIDKLNVPFADNHDIFGILNRSFQVGSNIGTLNILKLSEKDLKSFQTFIGKLSSVKKMFVEDICAHSTEMKDDFSLLSSLTSFNTIEYLDIFECHKTMILSADMAIDLLRRSQNIKFLVFGTGNIEFVRSVFKGFFKVEQPRKMEDECDYDEITLQIYFNGEYGLILDILRSSLSEVENVVEINNSNPEDVEFKSNVDCKYCFKNKHSISKYFLLCNTELSAYIGGWG
uniref:F-box domain-containing protein n=1 Tax=Strongyloides papillosus TaxID=174720 RepID=A0A0N5CCV8_STREA